MVDVNGLNKDLFRQLASFAMGPVGGGSRKPSDYEIALQIMQNQPVNFSGTWSPALGGVVPEKKDKDKGPGVFGHIIDYLLRPMYASAAAFKASGGLSSGIGTLYNLVTGDFEDPAERYAAGIKAGFRGLAGKDKTTYSQMIRENEDLPEWMRKGASGFATGLAADIAGDPLTYVPILGPAKALGRVGFSVAGKEAPHILLPTATKKALKAAKVGSPKAETFALPKVVESGQTPKAFQFLTKAAAGSKALPTKLPKNSGAALSEGDVARELYVRAHDLLTHIYFDVQGHSIGFSQALGRKMMNVGNKSTYIQGLMPALEVFPKIKHLTHDFDANADEIIKAISAMNVKGHFTGKGLLSDIRKGIPATHGVHPKAIAAYGGDQVGYVRNAIGMNPVNAAAKAFEDAPVVNTALEQGARETAIAENILSPQQAALHTQNIVADGSIVLKAANVGPAALKTYQQMLPEFTYKSRGPIQNAIDRNANKIALAITPATRTKFRGPKGHFRPSSAKLPLIPKAVPEIPKTAKKPSVFAPKGVFGPVNTAVSNAIRQNSGIQITKLAPGQTISERSTVHGIMSRFATWVGQKDLRPLVLDHQASALARAGQLREAMERAFKGFSEQEALEAWELARKAKPYGLASTPEVAKLADILTGQMEVYFRSRAIPEKIAKANSAAMRSGMKLDDINRMLARYNIPFKFTAGTAIDPVTHSAISYEKGTNWLISWETHAPKNATELKKFLFGLQAAAQQTMATYAFLDDVAYRMGSRSKTALKNIKVAHPRLVDYYFDKDIADQLSTAIKTMDEFYNPKSPVTRFVRQGVSMWKTGVTIYNPRHHIANAIGDTFLMWMAGINDPRVFSKAAKVLFANKGQYKDLATVEQLVGIDAMKNVLAKPGTIVAKNKSGAVLSAQQAYVAMFNHGLLQRSAVVEDLVREGLPLNGRLAKPLGGKVHGFAAKSAETREHYIKIAHFIGAFEKSRGKDLRAAIEDVAHEVRKWHPDGLDLTKEEQAIRSLIIPFYSWMRKSTPIILEGALMNPNKAFTSYAKVNYNLQSSLGIEGITPSNPYPSDQLFPSWLKDDNTPVLGKAGMPGLAGFIGGLGRGGVDEEGKSLNGYVMGMPTNPVQDFFTQFGGFRNFSETKDAVLSTLNPGIRIPLELQQGRELYTQIPLKGRHTDYLTNQIPMVNQVARMTNVGPFGPTGRAEKYGYGNKEAFLNWALNTNLIGSGPYIKSAEFELLPEKREENKRIREFSADIGYPLKEKGRIPQWIRDLYNQRQAQRGEQ